ncbi:MAG: enoyl-CoA hydratase/isomerase family protein [Rhodothermales bacterium]
MSDSISFETVLYEQTGAVATITMNRPERRNALNRALERDLTDALRRARDDAGVRALVLTGAGPSFCSGADLSSFPEDYTGEHVRRHILENYWPIVRLLATMEKPTLAAINGVAAGAGCSVALACDLNVMAEDAFLLQAFSNIGLVPDAGSSWFLARQVGYHRAYEIAVEGERIPAGRCLELGLTNKVVPSDQLVTETRAWAAHLSKRPTLALGLTKRAIRAAIISSLATTVELEAKLQARCFESEDHAEGVMAFLQKREPAFKGR